MEAKTCTRCGQTKPLSGFHRDPSHSTGRKSHCRSCVAKERLRIKAGLPPPPPAVLTEKACQRCGKTQPIGEFHRYVRSLDGYRHLCKRCWQISLSRAKTNFTPKEQAVLLALRQNGLRLYQMEGRCGDNLRTTMKDLMESGLVQRDAQDYYELTEAGKLACPCRNPHYAKRLRTGWPTPAAPVKASLDPPATGEAAR